jgi:hypothetical protein
MTPRIQQHEDATRALDVTKPYTFLGCGVMDVTKPYKFIGLGDIHGPKPYEFIGVW